VLATLATGIWAKLTARAPLPTSRVRSTKASGGTTKRKAMAHTCIAMERSMWGTGKKICRREVGWRPGQMEARLKESTKLGKSTEWETTCGLMEQDTMVSGVRMRSVGLGTTSGRMGVSSWEVGFQTL